MKTTEETIRLASAIHDFLGKYAKKAADGSGDWNGPDSACFESAMNSLNAGYCPQPVFSEWGSGCYAPSTSEEGKRSHDSLVQWVDAIIKYWEET